MDIIAHQLMELLVLVVANMQTSLFCLFLYVHETYKSLFLQDYFTTNTEPGSLKK